MITFLVALSAASAGVIAPSAVVVQGPSRKTTLVGPEGSVISAVAPGGQVITEEHPGVVAHAAPVHAAPIVAAPIYSAPVHAAPVFAAPVHAAHAHAALAPQVIAAVIVDPIAPGHHGVAGGQYVHDHSEALYDDGSYKPHVY